MPALIKVEEIGQSLQTFLLSKYFKPVKKAFSVSSYVLVWQSTLSIEGTQIESWKGHQLFKDTHLMYLAFHDDTLNEVMLGVTQPKCYQHAFNFLSLHIVNVADL